MHTAYSTQHTAHSTEHTAHSTQHTVNSTQQTAKHTSNSTQQAEHSTQHTAHVTAHTEHRAQSTEHRVQSTEHRGQQNAAGKEKQSYEHSKVTVRADYRRRQSIPRHTHREGTYTHTRARTHALRDGTQTLTCTLVIAHRCQHMPILPLHTLYHAGVESGKHSHCHQPWG
jgi:hypothetical protein